MHNANRAIKRKIAKSIVLAQIASDAAKSIFPNDFYGPLVSKKEMEYAAHNGYAAKEKLIQKACNLISGYRKSGFKFYCTKSVITKSLFYFTFFVKGKEYQVSFHSLNENAKWKSHNKEFVTMWDESSSRNACRVLSNMSC